MQPVAASRVWEEVDCVADSDVELLVHTNHGLALCDAQALPISSLNMFSLGTYISNWWGSGRAFGSKRYVMSFWSKAAPGGWPVKVCRPDVESVQRFVSTHRRADVLQLFTFLCALGVPLNWERVFFGNDFKLALTFFWWKKTGRSS